MKNAFQKILDHHLDRYPAMEAADLYKLAFQAAMGGEHAVADAQLARRRLNAEAAALTPSTAEPLMTLISPYHHLVRVGLRPYIALGGNLDALARAFVMTAETVKPALDRLATYWAWIEEMADPPRSSITCEALMSYGARQRDLNYPPVHHSEHYRRLYRPACRVVAKDLLTLPPA